MIEYSFENILGNLVFAAIVLFGIFVLICSIRLSPKKSAPSDGISEEEPTETELHGKIVEKMCFTESRGTLTPRMGKRFCLTLQTDDGEQKEYAVDEDIYHSVDEGQIGTALIVGKRFYGFCPDEDPNGNDQLQKTE